MIQGFVLPALSDPDKRTLIRGSLAIAFLLLVSKGLPAYRAWAHDTAAARDEELGDAVAVPRSSPAYPPFATRYVRGLGVRWRSLRQFSKAMAQGQPVPRWRHW